MQKFSDLFAQAREAAHMTQAEVALNVSHATIASWETERRRPNHAGARGKDGRQLVIEAADLFGIDTPALNTMLDALGFSRVPTNRFKPLLDRRVPLDVMREECWTYEWPVLAMSEDFEIVAWNEAINDVSEQDIGVALSEPQARNLFRIVLSPQYRNRLVNWDDVVSIMVGMWKVGGNDITNTQTSPYLQNLMAYVVANHAVELPHLFALWQSAPLHEEGRRLSFRVDWRLDDGTMLAFDNTMTPWSDFDGVAALDWHPADAATSEWLAQRRQGRQARGSRPPASEQPSNARAMLRAARDRAGLSRRALAERAGVVESLVHGVETGTKALNRERLVGFGRAMVLDTVSLNAILEAAGFEPEMSEMVPYLIGLDLSRSPRHAMNQPPRVLWTPEMMQGQLDEYGWPTLLVNDRCEVTALNRKAAALLGLSLAELPSGAARNLIAITTTRGFRAAVDDWAGTVANVLPGNLEGYILPDESEAAAGETDHDRETREYFDGVVRYVREREAAEGRDASVVHELLAAWRAAPHRRLTARVTFPLEWSAAGEAMRFNVIISPWNSIDPYWAIDLHPADGATWRALG